MRSLFFVLLTLLCTGCGTQLVYDPITGQMDLIVDEAARETPSEQTVQAKEGVPKVETEEIDPQSDENRVSKGNAGSRSDPIDNITEEQQASNPSAGYIAAPPEETMSLAEQLEHDQNDGMQQIINYLVTGDPLRRVREGQFGLSQAHATIFNREECIIGLGIGSLLGTGIVAIHFNNIDPKSIGFETRYVSEDLSQLVAAPEGYHDYLKLSGTPVAVTLDGVASTQESILLGDIDRSRAREAIDLLYSEYCSGRSIETQF